MDCLTSISSYSIFTSKSAKEITERTCLFFLFVKTILLCRCSVIYLCFKKIWYGSGNLKCVQTFVSAQHASSCYRLMPFTNSSHNFCQIAGFRLSFADTCIVFWFLLFISSAWNLPLSCCSCCVKESAGSFQLMILHKIF